MIQDPRRRIVTNATERAAAEHRDPVTEVNRRLRAKGHTELTEQERHQLDTETEK